MNAPAKIPGPVYHEEFEQGSGLWMKARSGLLTASEFDRIITPTLKVADNVKSRAHLWEIAAQRISAYVEPQYISDAMLRGHEDEIRARELYTERFAPVVQVGFVTNGKWGFTLGCSPDGLVGDDGLIEVKSRCQRYHVQTLCEWRETGKIPEEFMLQIQGQLLITERSWCDFISYCGGLPTFPMRVEADPAIQDAIVEAAARFEGRINEAVATFAAASADAIPTERVIEQEMII
jgi:hypothetical protein